MFRYAPILNIPLQDLTTLLISLDIVCHLRQTIVSRGDQSPLLTMVKPTKVKPYLEWVFIFPNSSSKFLRQINALSSGKIDFVHTQFILLDISVSFAGFQKL